MSEIVQITDHSDQAVDRLASQFKGKAKIEGLITAFTDQLQELENVGIDLLQDRYLDTAVGDQLDIIGAIVGQTRDGRSDDSYRNRIIAKIGQNTSKGLPENLISVFNLLTDSTRSVYLPYYPACTYILANLDISALDTDDILTFCQFVLPAGVRLGLIGYYVEDEYFGFYADARATGFGEISDPTTGGKFAEIVEFV